MPTSSQALIIFKTRGEQGTGCAANDSLGTQSYYQTGSKGAKCIFREPAHYSVVRLYSLQGGVTNAPVPRKSSYPSLSYDHCVFGEENAGLSDIPIPKNGAMAAVLPGNFNPDRVSPWSWYSKNSQSISCFHEAQFKHNSIRTSRRPYSASACHLGSQGISPFAAKQLLMYGFNPNTIYTNEDCVFDEMVANSYGAGRVRPKSAAPSPVGSMTGLQSGPPSRTVSRISYQSHRNQPSRESRAGPSGYRRNSSPGPAVHMPVQEGSRRRASSPGLATTSKRQLNDEPAPVKSESFYTNLIKEWAEDQLATDESDIFDTSPSVLFRVKPSMHMRKEAVAPRPTAAVFSFRDNEYSSHAEVKYLIEKQIGVKVKSIQFDPLDIRASLPHVHSRWIVDFFTVEDLDAVISKGLIIGKYQLIFHKYDDVMRREHSTFKFYKTVEDAKKRIRGTSVGKSRSKFLRKV